MNNTLPPPSLSRANRLSRGALIGLISTLLCARALPVVAQVDNFNGGNDTGWVRVNPIDDAATTSGYPPFNLATWAFPEGGYRIACQTPAVPDFGPARAGSMWTNAGFNYTNFYVSIEVRPWGEATNQAIGILSRIQSFSGYGAIYAYTLTYEPNVRDLQITRYDGASYTAVVAKKVTLSPAESHRFVFVGTGESLEGRVYLSSDPLHPLETVTGTDAGYVEGWSGLLVFDSSGAGNQSVGATFDNYAALAEEPPALSIEVSNLQTTISWPVTLSSYTLQSADWPTSDNWTNITSGVTQSGQRFYFQAVPSNARFYRLIRN